MKKKKNTYEPRQIYMFWYPQVIEFIRLLASPFEIQISAFPKNEFPPDEIADEIDYKCHITESFFKEGFVTLNEYENVKLINEKFKSFTKEDWTIEAMNKSSKWKKIREMALKALETFRVDYAKPNIYWYPLLTLKEGGKDG